MKEKIIPAIAVVALVLAGWAIVRTGVFSSQSLGAAGGLLAENYLPFMLYNGGFNTAKSIKTTGDLTIGASGTARVNDIDTTCSMVEDASAGATSTVYAYCTGVTGVTSSDTIIASFASSTAVMTDQWIIAGAKASTTAGAIDFRLVNLTGTARAMSAASVIGSSTVIKAGH